jgi:uncharacterized membrane protein YjjP (DUF1212 family)
MRFTMGDRRLQTKLLLQAGRLLLEYNESTEAIRRALTATAKTMTDETCHVAISYEGVAVSLEGHSPVLESVRELRYNTAVQARVHEVLEQLRQGNLDASAALACLREVEADTPHHSRWLAALFLGTAASSLAGLLGADLGAATVSGLASGLGLFVRQALGRRHFSLLMLPLTAAFLGAALGGLAIRFGWTQTPELALIVPALMLVPGPHLINGLLDLIDNHLPMSLSRLGLAMGIMLASALGVVLGVELTLPGPFFPRESATIDHLNLVSDVILAGIVTCGFAVFYNTPWRQLGSVAVGGMAGHGLRFLLLEAGCGLEAATFLGGLTVGALSALMARSIKAPFAVVAFAGAVTMIPGLSLYSALGGAFRMARFPDLADPVTVAGTLSHALQGVLVVSGLGLGLILGARTVLALARKEDSAVRPRPGSRHDEAPRPVEPEPANRPEAIMESVPLDSGNG